MENYKTLLEAELEKIGIDQNLFTKIDFLIEDDISDDFLEKGLVREIGEERAELLMEWLENQRC